MHFAEELADADKLHVPKKLEAGKTRARYGKSARRQHVVEMGSEKYRDDYREALMEVIEEKVEAGGKEIEEKPKPKPRPSTKVIDLVSVLQESLNKTKKSHHARKSSAATRHTKGRVILSVAAAVSAAHATSRTLALRDFVFWLL